MNTIILYLFPLCFDIIVSVSLFAGRHSLAERGLDTASVGTILTMYGIGYIVASLLAGRIIRPAIAKYQMIASTVVTAIILVALANCEQVRVIQGFFMILPLSASFFFNSFQSFMLGVNTDAGKPVTKTAAQFTGSWSIGFALGPIVAAFVKNNLSWSWAYYAAAGVAICIGITATFFRPPKSAAAPEAAVAPSDKPPKSLAIAAWIGVLTGWTALNMIFTCWPVQAEALSIDVRVKGAVEFCFAIAQSLTAFTLAAVPASYYYSKRLPLAGLFGIACALLFAFSTGSAGFILGALLCGVYTGHIMNAMVFHSMVEKQKAVKRVAINEVCVGICFLIASPLANNIPKILPLHKILPGLGGPYLGIALLIVVGLAVEWAVITRIRRV